MYASDAPADDVSFKRVPWDVTLELVAAAIKRTVTRAGNRIYVLPVGTVLRDAPSVGDRAYSAVIW